MQNAENQTEGLAILKATSVEFQHSSGKKYPITPVRMGQLSEFAKAVKPIAGQLMSLSDGGEEGGEVDMLDLVANDADKIIAVVAIGSGISADELADWQPDDFLSLVLCVVRMNIDFFANRLLPKMRQELDAIRETTKGLKAAIPGMPPSAP